MPVTTPEIIATIRARYSEGATLAQIVAETQVSHGTIYKALDGWDDGSGPRLPPLPRRRLVLGKRRRPLKGDRVSLVARLWRTAERQVRDIEARLAREQQKPTEREQDARVLAVLVRTLRELTSLDAARAQEKPDGGEANDECDIRDIDEFRRDLARRMDEIARGREDQVPREPSSA